jgi:general secretion pathway protein G
VIGKFRRSVKKRTGAQSQIANRKSQVRGFSLLELMIAMFILIILISVALPTYRYTVQHARETVLKENLRIMRSAIDQYNADKGKLPQSIDDLVEQKYLREKPVDPVTENSEWEQVMGEDPGNPDGGQGMVDVKSTAEGEDTNGKQYKEY